METATELTTEEIVAWLESPEGELWSRTTHKLFHSGGAIASIKEDDEGGSYAISDPRILEGWMKAWPAITGWTPDDPPEGGKPE